ncbi:MAG: TIGR00730 family Rossman fold protein [Prevotella sp.]|nr:TIGR00730 family Rossman fold protein [Prevotella sp.]
MNICVFCSANENIDPEFFTMTSQLGEWIGRHGHALIYGGCDMGLMECVAKAVRKSGGKVIGVIPSRLEQGGHASKYIDERITCDTLGERKKLMLENSDAIVALPGGIGTLDEIFTVASEGTLSYHDKRVIVYNMKGFWNELQSLLNSLQKRGLMRGDYHRRICFANSLDELVKYF